MAKINVKGARTAKPAAFTPLKTVAQDTVTFEGAPAYSRDAKSDLFLLSVASFYGETSFYESAPDRVARFKGLVRQVAIEDPEWMAHFLPWLRRDANIRTAAIVGVLEFVKARLDAKVPSVPAYEIPGFTSDKGIERALIDAVITRADEPAEALAYWLTTYGRKVPAPVRRGIADAALRLYNERNFIKWDSDSNAVRMADVLNLTHPDPDTSWKSTLFKYILDARRDRNVALPAQLKMLTARAAITALSTEDRAKLLNVTGIEPVAIAGLPMLPVSQILADAGMTWEQVSSWGKFTAATWEALIPTMGIFAITRNLRNFQEAGIGKAAIAHVSERLSSSEEIANSRMLPFRFLSAYQEATNPAWALPLETALQLSTANIPSLPGRTLVLIDTSGSMVGATMSGKSKVKATTAGALFGVALAAKGEAVDVYAFDNTVRQFTISRGGSVLRDAERFDREHCTYGGGTETAKALKATFSGHDRVIIFTDEQTFGPSRGYWQGDVGAQVPENVPVYSFNLVGYAPAMLETSATRHQLGGLTDQSFTMIPMVESGQQAKWPWVK